MGMAMTMTVSPTRSITLVVKTAITDNSEPTKARFLSAVYSVNANATRVQTFFIIRALRHCTLPARGQESQKALVAK